MLNKMALSNRIAADFTAFERKGSDEFTELLCEPCQDDGDHLQAVGFCVDCSEYLCQECYRNHSKNRLSRSHLLQDKTDMPKSKPESSIHMSGETNADSLEECHKHKGHMFEFYCRSHEELGCGTCLFFKHRECKEIIHIEEEYKKFEDKIDIICSQIDVQVTTLSNNRKKIESIHSKAIIDVNDFMTDIRCYIDTLEKDMKSLADDFKDKDNESLGTTTDKCLTLKKEVETLATDIKTLFSLHKIRQLFKAMDNATEQIKRAETTLMQISNNNSVKIYEFEPEKQLQHIIKTVKYLGKLRTNEKYLQSDENIHNNAAKIITRFIRCVAERKREANQEKTTVVKIKGVEEQLCEVNVDNLMCGFCGVNFKAKLQEQLENEKSTLAGSSFTAPIRPFIFFSATNPFEKRKSYQIGQRESTADRLQHIKDTHVQDEAHIRKIDEYNFFVQGYTQCVAPTLFKIKQFLFNPDLGLTDIAYREATYPLYMIEIERMQNKCNLVEKELQLLLSSRLWIKTGHIEQTMKELYTDWHLVEPYVLAVQAKLKQEEKNKSRVASGATSLQFENRYGEHEDVLDDEPLFKSQTGNVDKRPWKKGRRRGNRR